MKETGERILPKKFESSEEYLIFLRHLYTYKFIGEGLKWGKREKEKKKVLEIGCGEGYGTNFLSKYADVIGIDIDEESIDHAKKKYGFFFFKFDGIKIPYNNNSFDIVVSLQVIEHVKDVQGYLREIKRVLKDKGIFYVSTPNKEIRLDKGKIWNKFHFREYYADELRNELNKFFNNIKIFGLFGEKNIIEIEKKRIDNIKRLYKIDPLNLRTVLPGFIKSFLSDLIIWKTVGNKPVIRQYSLNDFKFKKETKGCLDLLGVCR